MKCGENMKFRLLERAKSNPGLRQFIFSALKEKLSSDYDIHHLNGVHKDNTGTNISLIPHKIHSKISYLLRNPSSENEKQLRSLLMEHGLGLDFNVAVRELSKEEIGATIAIIEREVSSIK